MNTYKTTCPRLRIVAEKSDFPTIKINNAMDAANFIRNFYPGDIEIFESFFLLMLNRANNTIGFAKISQGGVSGTVVDIKIIAKYAVDSLASSVILCHNHPSGNTQPSDADKNISAKIKTALSYLDIKVLDNLIITAENYFSFADNGLM
jgi:DNA repair protein RadC